MPNKILRFVNIARMRILAKVNNNGDIELLIQDTVLIVIDLQM